MKLNELIIRGKERYDYSDVANELAWQKRGRPGIQIKTNIPNITLDVREKKYEAAGFQVLILDKNEPVGFVYFVHPDKVRHGKLPRDTWTPHSGVLKSHTGKGYISAVYRWFLNSGHNLITGEEQTMASNALWRSLSRHYKLQFIGTDGTVIRDITPAKAQHPDTRMILIGKHNRGLNELLSKDVPYEVTRETATSFVTRAVIGGRTIEFYAEDEGGGSWDVSFIERQKHDNWPVSGKPTYKKTGSGAAFDVGAMVLKSLREFIQRYAPLTIEFSASNDTRANIYRRSMAKHFPEYKLEVDSKSQTYVRI